MSVKWLIRRTVLALHEASIGEHGGLSGIRDAGMLDSALMRPVNRQAYEPGGTLSALAASYAFGLARNHPFADGNKRIALLAMLTFLEINGWEFDASREETLTMFLALAAGEVDENQLATWIENNIVPVTP